MDIIKKFPVDLLVEIVQLGLWAADAQKHGLELIYQDEELMTFRHNSLTKEPK